MHSCTISKLCEKCRLVRCDNKTHRFPPWLGFLSRPGHGDYFPLVAILSRLLQRLPRGGGGCNINFSNLGKTDKSGCSGFHGGKVVCQILASLPFSDKTSTMRLVGFTHRNSGRYKPRPARFRRNQRDPRASIFRSGYKNSRIGIHATPTRLRVPPRPRVLATTERIH